MDTHALVPLIAFVAYVPLLGILLANRPWQRQQKLLLLYLIPAIAWSFTDFLFRGAFFPESDHVLLKVVLCTGLWMGGMNENWVILYNRFRVERGNGVFARTGSFDHILRGNVFVLKDPESSMIHLATADCTGLEAVGNRLYGGNGQVVSGKAKPIVLERNQAFPLADAERPQPAVPSIYEWQRSRAPR